MGWIDVLTDTVKGLRATGKIDGMFYEVAAPTRYEARTESNNWRKMHGLPMRRKGGKRHGRTGSSHRH